MQAEKCNATCPADCVLKKGRKLVNGQQCFAEPDEHAHAWLNYYDPDATPNQDWPGNARCNARLAPTE